MAKKQSANLPLTTLSRLYQEIANGVFVVSGIRRWVSVIIMTVSTDVIVDMRKVI